MSSKDLKTIEFLVGQNLKKIRQLKGFSQMQVAEELGVSFQQLQKYEKGINRISAGKVYLLSKVFDVPIISFFDFENEREGAKEPLFDKEDLKMLHAFKLLKRGKTQREAIEFCHYLSEVEKKVGTGS